jgi:hypothetical protein
MMDFFLAYYWCGAWFIANEESSNEPQYGTSIDDRGDLRHINHDTNDHHDYNKYD